MSSGCGWFIFWRIARLVGFRCGLVVAGCLCLCCLICLWFRVLGFLMWVASAMVLVFAVGCV